MAISIIVEDGTGVSGANSYVDAAYVAAYAESIESEVWSNNVSRQNAALINATRYIDAKYRTKLPGTVKQSTQELLWPRSTFTDGQGRLVETGTIPKALKDAVAAAALYYLDGGLDLNADEGNNVKSTSTNIGNSAVAESVSYWSKSEASAYPLIEGFMGPLIARSGKNSFTVGVSRG